MLELVLGNLATSPESIEFEPDLSLEISFVEKVIITLQIKLLEVFGYFQYRFVPIKNGCKMIVEGFTCILKFIDLSCIIHHLCWD